MPALPARWPGGGRPQLELEFAAAGVLWAVGMWFLLV